MSDIRILANGKEETILNVQNLHKSYGDKEVLNDINFSVRNGQFISIIGSSGAGKSTLLRCINRMVEPTSGTIEFKYDQKYKVEKNKDFKYRVDTQEIASANKKELREVRKRIAMIFQHYNLVDRVSAIENVLHGRLGHMSTLKGMLGIYDQEIVEKAQELLGEMGIEDQTYKKCSALSGGQKQRVGIARGLIQNPNLMLCDEPIASLDPVSAVQIMETLRKVATEMHVPCLVNLHQVDIAKKYSDRIIGINSGKIIFDGKPSQLTKDIIDKIYKGKKNEQKT